MKFQENAKVLGVRKSGIFTEILLESPQISAHCYPGQFVNVRASQGLDPLLRRPISICDNRAEGLTLLINPVGNGSEYLCNLKEGDFINLLGPLGNAFPDSNKDILQVAGGVGIAPFRFLSRRNPGSVLLFGARSKDFSPDLKPFEEVCNVQIATDDGSSGVQGNVLTLLDDYDLSEFTLYACGPTPMFRALQDYLNRKAPDADAWFSLETYMGCGFGACKGCTVEMTDGSYQLCCTDGPVFQWNTVKL